MKQRRQSSALRSLSLVPPSSSEAEALHSYFLQYGQDNRNGTPTSSERVWMGDTNLEKCMQMFPQERKLVLMSVYQI